ncbi:MAG: hypothetical protein ACKVH0_14215, partial [Alphaproteobacteria bacterium]
EEIRLKAAITGNRLKIERRTVDADATAVVTVHQPDGTQTDIALEAKEDGRAVGELEATALGLYRVTEGPRATLALKGDPSGPEAQDIRADATKLAPALNASEGAAWSLHMGMPDLRMARAGRSAHGRGWIGLRANRAYTVTSVKAANLPPISLALGLICAGLLWGWARER